jgi:tetratricopeptide (TPR) repeat protein
MSRPRVRAAAAALGAFLLAACAGSAAQRAARDANELLLAGKVEEALAAYREAQRHSPEFADLHYGEGLALYRMKRYREAEVAFRNAIKRDPQIAAYHLYLGHVLSRQERLEAARDAYREATRLAPIDAEGWKGLGLTEYNLGRGREARVALEKYLAFAPAANDRNAISRLVRSLPGD